MITRGRIYAGPAGRVLALPPIKHDELGDLTPELFGGVFTGYDGTVSMVSNGFRRTWELGWNKLRHADVSAMGRIPALYRKQLKRRAYIVDTRWRNLLHPDVASADDPRCFVATTGALTRPAYGTFHPDLAEYIDGWLAWTTAPGNSKLTANPSFEQGATSWAVTGGSLSLVSGGVSGGGTQHGRVTATGANVLTLLNTSGWFPVADGEPHTVTYSARTSAGQAVYSVVNWYNQSGNFLSTTSGAGGTSASGVWATYTDSHTPPATAFRGLPGLRTAAAATSGATMDLDAVTVTARAVLRSDRRVPVIDASDYVFSAYVQATGGTVTPYARLYDLGGAVLSTVLGTPVTPAAATRVSLSLPAATLLASGTFDVGFTTSAASSVTTTGWQVQIDQALSAYVPGAGSAEVVVTSWKAPMGRHNTVAPMATFREVY